MIALWALANPSQRAAIRAHINPKTPNTSQAPQARQATGAGETDPTVSPATHSLERGAEQASAISPTVDRSSVRSAADGAHSIDKTAQVRAPLNSDPFDPGPIPSFMDRRGLA